MRKRTSERNIKFILSKRGKALKEGVKHAYKMLERLTIEEQRRINNEKQFLTWK